jgi:hypothetical protein
MDLLNKNRMKSNLYIILFAFQTSAQKTIQKPISKRTITSRGWLIKIKSRLLVLLFENGNKKKKAIIANKKMQMVDFL